MSSPLRMFITFFLLSMGLLGSGPAQAAEPIYPFEKTGEQRLTPDFQAWHPEFEENDDYGESWFYVVQTDEGGLLCVLLSVTNLGLHTFDGSVDVDFYAPDGSVHKAHHEVRREAISGSGDRMDVTIGGSRTWGGGSSYHVTIQESDVQLRLDFANVLPPYQFGNGRVVMREDRSAEWTTGWNIPRARSSGSVTMDGRTWDLAGDGYGDHGWATIKLPDYIRKWYTLRVFDDAYTLVLHHQYLTDTFGRGNVKFGLVGEGEGIVGASRHFLYTPTAWRTVEGGKRIPTAFDVTVRTGGYEITGTVTESRFLEAIDVLGRLSWPIRTAIKTFYTDVWIIRYMGHYELDVTHGGETRHISGEAYVEANLY